MLSKLATSAGKCFFGAQGTLRTTPRQVARFASSKGEVAQSNSGVTAMAMQHIGELNKLGTESDALERTVERQIKQLSKLSLKDQVLYCEFADKKWSHLDTFVQEAMRTVTVQARDGLKPRLPDELAREHASKLKAIDPSSWSIEKAVWAVDLMLCERIKLSSDDQEKYVQAMTKEFPEAIKVLSSIQGIGYERQDFVQEVSNLARNIAPSTSDFLDEAEAQKYRNDFRAHAYLARNEPSKIVPYFVDEADNEFHSNIMDTYAESEGRRRREDPDVRVKVDGCVKKMRAIKDVASLKSTELLRLEGQKLDDAMTKLQAKDIGCGDDIQAKMETVWYESCLFAKYNTVKPSEADVKQLFPTAVEVHGSNPFLVKFEDADAIVAATEALESDENIEYDCINFHRHIGDHVELVEAGDYDMIERMRVQRWKHLREMFNSPERDHKNFPDTDKIMSEVNYKFLPKNLFDAMYDKTGVSGPHFLVYGIFMLAFAKEYFILNAHTLEKFLIVFWAHYQVFSYIHPIGSWWQKTYLRVNEAMVDGAYEKPKSQTVEAIKEHTATMKEKLAQFDEPSPVFQAMLENLQLQMEAEYRRRMEDVHNAVKKRLDLQVALAQARRQYETEAMVNWIVKSVNESITPELEKAIMAKCFTDLNSLSQQYSKRA